jgi:hypothetical protein
MRYGLSVALIYFAINTGASAASVRVVFEGVVSGFDSGYEEVMSLGERVHGTLDFEASPEMYQSDEFFGPVSVTSFLLTGMTVGGESGWSVETPSGVILHGVRRQQATPPLNQPFDPNYRFSALGGAVSFPALQESVPLPTPGEGDVIRADLNGDGVIAENEIIGVHVDYPDIYTITAPVPYVWNPILALTISGPPDWWATFASSPLPPSLDGALESVLKLNVQIFVPSYGLKTQTATMTVTDVRVVPEPSAWSIALGALAIWPVCATRGAWRRRVADC